MSEDYESSRYKQGRWTKDEQGLFKLAYQWHGKDWKKLSEVIPTRNIKQIRSHAQKFQKKMDKKLGAELNSVKIHVLESALSGLTDYISQICSLSYKKYIECQNLLMYSQPPPIPQDPKLSQSPNKGELSHN